jgi:hypothetical protein
VVSKLISEGNGLHVEEDLEPGVEAGVRDLLPDLAQLLLVDLICLHPQTAAQCVEQLERELLGFRHPCRPGARASPMFSNYKMNGRRRRRRRVAVPMHSAKSARARNPSQARRSKLACTSIHALLRLLVLMKRSPRSALCAPERVRSSCARGEGGFDAGLRLLLVSPLGAAVGAAKTLGEVLREVARDGHGLRLELLRELQQQVRRGPPDRRGLRPRRGRRRARGRLDAAQHNGVVVLQVERDLDELLAVVGAPQRGARAERARRRPRRPAPSLRVGGGGRGGAAPHQSSLSSADPGTVQCFARSPRVRCGGGGFGISGKKAPPRRVVPVGAEPTKDEAIYEEDERLQQPDPRKTEATLLAAVKCTTSS